MSNNMQNFRINRISFNNGSQDEIFVDKAADTDDSFCTIIIGENGTGKSTLMRDIVLTLRSMTQGRFKAQIGLKNTYASRVNEISLSNGNIQETVSVISREKMIAIEGINQSSADAVAPKRIIAISFTAFDKFPMSQGGSSVNSLTPRIGDIIDDRYVYLGQRQGGIMSGVRQRIFSSIDLAIYRSYFSGNSSTADIEFVLKQVGYAPRMQFMYYINPRHQPSKSSVDLSTSFESFISRTYSRNKPLAISNEQLRNALEEIKPHFMGGGVINVSLDISGGENKNELDKFLAARILYLAGFLSIRSVGLYRTKLEKFVDILEASSGEINIITSFLGLASVMEDGSLVLIDEPENSLHPDWQNRYIKILTEVFRHFQGCHYIISTHSPIIASGAAGLPSKILSLDGLGINYSRDKISDASPDAVLINAFGMIPKNNNYVRLLIMEALHFSNKGKTKDPRYIQIKELFRKFVGMMEDNDPLREVVYSISRQGADS